MQNFKKVRLLSGALILFAVLLATGCQPPRSASPLEGYEDTPYGSSDASGRRSAGSEGGMQIQKEWEERTREMVLDAASLAKGTPYVFGGTSLSGFDCSGFVRWAYDMVGVSLPRSAREQSQFGKSVDRANLRVGDIVAFRHPKRGYHTGLYVGGGQFIHSPSRRDVVKVSSLTDPYFSGSYLGARRPALSKSVDLDQVKEKLLAIKAQKKALQTASLSRKRTADAKKAEAVSKKSSSRSKKNAVSSSSKSKAKSSSNKSSAVKASSKSASITSTKASTTSTKKTSSAKASTKKDSAKKNSSKKTSAKSSTSSSTKKTSKSSTKK